MLVDWMMAVLRFAAVASVCPRVVTREEWGARTPIRIQEMRGPARYVVIHHTYLPPVCFTASRCAGAMRTMQDLHQLVQGWDDIGYNFVIGGDGRVYKGRGWSREGAHAPPYNNQSIGIFLIGDWRYKAPPKSMLDMAQWLVRCGVDTGRIAPDYELIGHRQAPTQTECPGQALTDVIKGWPHYTEHPKGPCETPLPTEAPLLVSSTTSTSVPDSNVLPPLIPIGLPEEQVDTSRVLPVGPAASEAASEPEVRQLNKRSLWERLVEIWKKDIDES